MSIRTQRGSTRFGVAAIAAALIASLFAFASPAGAAQQLQPTERLSGADRYATAVAIASELGCSNDIILASGENQPDALAAASLSGLLDAPVVLTTTNGLPASTAAFIGNCGAKGLQTVHILGGTAAVSESVANQVAGIAGVTVKRISGADRYETAAAVSAIIGASSAGELVGKRTVILASGLSWADALAAGPLAAAGVQGGINAGPHPILLTEAGTLSSATATALDSLDAQHVIIVGGTAVVSDAVKSAIEAKGISTSRVSGANRYATAAALAELAFTPVGKGGFGFNPAGAGLANGTDAFGGFDALAAAALLGDQAAPLLLTADSLPAETSEFLTAFNRTIESLTVFGGTAAVSAATVTAAEEAATLSSPTATLVAGDGHSNFTAVFSEAVPVAEVQSADFAINNGAGNRQPTGTPNAIDQTTVNGVAVATTFVIDVVNGPLAIGDIVSLKASTVKTADARFVLPASVTVAKDTTKPVATVLAAPNTNTFIVDFNEPVSSATATDDANYVATPGTGNAALSVTGAVLASSDRRVTVTVSRDLEPGDKVGIVDSVIEDLAATPNKAAGVIVTVLADNVAPKFLSASGQIIDTSAAKLIVDANGDTGVAALQATAVQYDAKAPGSAGNGIVVNYAAPAGNSVEVVNADLTLRTIQVQLREGGSTPAQIADAVNTNVFAQQLVTATAIGTAKLTAAVATSPVTTGGATSFVVDATFSEPVKALPGDFVAYTGATVGSTPLATANTASVVAGSPNMYRLTWNALADGPVNRPGATPTLVAQNTITDLADNHLVATARNISLG